MTRDKALVILGLTSSASNDQIQDAYRDLMKKYHPDKVTHLGEEFKKIAEEKSKEINEAYDALVN